MRCRCDECDKEFRLTAELDRTTGDDRTSHVDVGQAESCGVYELTVECPWCGFEHQLYW